METILLEILNELKESGSLDERRLGMIIHRHNRNVNDTRRHHSKKKLLPYYLKVKETDPRRW
ncbi:MAG: histone acetyltransferase, partial [Coriobacteriia bacterium]|nr:histone acetyltransferase [Coriobacteriia bacterium]